MRGTTFDSLSRSVLSLAEDQLRLGYLRSLLEESQPTALASTLDDVCRRAHQAEDQARLILVSLVDALLVLGDAQPVARFRVHAESESLWALERLLRTPRDKPDAAEEGVPEDPAIKAHPQGTRMLTLGERKALARKPDRVVLERLLVDPHPDVVRGILGNSRVTEADVLRMVTRRPCSPSVLTAVARFPKWSHRADVRRAIVLNPATPLGVSARLAALLLAMELREVIESPSLSPWLRALCAEHEARRPVRLSVFETEAERPLQ